MLFKRFPWSTSIIREKSQNHHPSEMMNVFRMFFYWPTTLTSFCDHPKLIISTKVIRVGSTTFCYPFLTIPLGDLYLISEKSIWKNQVRWTEFLVYFELDFYCLCSLQKSISKLIFAVHWTGFSNLIFQKSSTDG